MKRFLVLALIYSLNIMAFLFAQAANAEVIRENIQNIDLKTEREVVEVVKVTRTPAVI